MPPDQADLLSWRPSHEETPEHFKRTPDDPRDYSSEWAAVVRDRWSIAEYIERAALRKAAEGVSRISVDALWTEAREAFGLSLDNNLRAACGRWLAMRHEVLRPLVRTRKATRTKP
jgi:hypothetical protein